jgi:caffeoyl-CoA O-methyltransferase
VIEIAPAGETLAKLTAAGEKFDMVFLDADKAGYLAYLTAILDGGLLAPEGLICVDNTLMQGQPYLDGPISPNGAAIAEFNLAVAADERLEQVLVPLRDGLTLIRRL